MTEIVANLARLCGGGPTGRIWTLLKLQPPDAVDGGRALLHELWRAHSTSRRHGAIMELAGIQAKLMELTAVLTPAEEGGFVTLKPETDPPLKVKR